jgi:DNA-binding CsgD family transcriptional regulator
MKNTFTLKESHILLTSSPDIDAIIQPLKQQFGMTSLVYQRNFTDGSEIRLTNQPAWIKHYFEQNLYQISGFEKNPQHYQSGIAVWSHLTHHQPILNAARSFNIDHGITLIEKKSDGCEFYFIGATPDQPQVVNLLLNNIEYLKRFTFYFKNKAENLLKLADTQRLEIPQKYQTIISHELGIPYQNNFKSIHPLPEIKKIAINNTQSLTSREITCAKLLLQGKSARLIAEQLFVSPRTVEKHIEHLKAKLGCHDKPALINKLYSLNIQSL